jgi:hypothetical protein
MLSGWWVQRLAGLARGRGRSNTGSMQRRGMAVLYLVRLVHPRRAEIGLVLGIGTVGVEQPFVPVYGA